MEKQNKFEFETSLLVANYDGDFDACRADCKGALHAAADELLEAGVSQATLNRLQMSAGFVEFDSSNPSHAGGYFAISVSGEDADVNEVEQKWTAWMQG